MAPNALLMVAYSRQKPE